MSSILGLTTGSCLQSAGEHPGCGGDAGGLPGDRLTQVRGPGHQMGCDRLYTSDKVRMTTDWF